MRISDWSSDVCSSDLPIWLSIWISSSTQALNQTAATSRIDGIVRLSAIRHSGNSQPSSQLLRHECGFSRHAATTCGTRLANASRSEEHTSELQSHMRISYAVFCMKKKKTQQNIPNTRTHNRK